MELSPLFAITAAGPGVWSLDHVFGSYAAGTGWALAELATGLLGAMMALRASRLAHRRTRALHPSTA